MSDITKKEDPRIQKTKKSLMAALTKLLESHKYSQITVHNLCEEAMISRVTFYVYYCDKYDLLKHWLMLVKSEKMMELSGYEDIANRINNIAYNNRRILKNLLEDANAETMSIFCDFLLSLLNISKDDIDIEVVNPKYVIFSSFYCGGIINYLKWHVENKFPEDLPLMNTYLYNFLLCSLNWYAKQE